MKRQTFIQGSIVLIVSAVIVKLIGACFKIPLANLLGGEGMNYFGCGYSLFLPMYALMVNGLSPAVSKLTAERMCSGDYQTVEKVRHTTLKAFSTMGLLGSLSMVVLSKVFCRYVAGSPEAYLSVVALAPSVLFGCIGAVYRGYYEGLCNMVPTSVSQAVEALGKLAFGLGFCRYAISHYDTLSAYFHTDDVYAIASASAILGISLSTGVGLVVLLLFEPFRGSPKVRYTTCRKEERTLLRELFGVMVPIAIGSLATNLTTLIDLSTITRCLDSLDTQALTHRYGISTENFSGFVYGSYTGLAITIFNLVPSVTNMLSKGALPNVVHAWQRRDLTTLHRDVSDMLTVTSLIAIPSGLGITLLAKPILEFLYPLRIDEVAVSYESLACMGIGVVFLCLTFPLFSVLQGIDRPDLPIKVMLVGVVVKLIGNVALLSVPSVAVYGAGISTTVCYCVMYALTLVAFRKASGVRVGWFRVALPITYCGVLCAVSANVCNGMARHYIGTRVALLLAIAVGGGVYLLALYLMGFRLKSSPRYE
jgi:stage V sporulation protein B